MRRVIPDLAIHAVSALPPASEHAQQLRWHAGGLWASNGSEWLQLGSTPSVRKSARLLTASDPAVPIPEWAQAGRGMLYVTGTAAGGGSGITNTGGGSGGSAIRHPIIIPPAATTLAAGIGARGETTPTAGGDSFVSIAGQTPLTLHGGGLALSTSRGGPAGSISIFGTDVFALYSGVSSQSGYNVQHTYAALMSHAISRWPDTLVPGRRGYESSVIQVGVVADFKLNQLLRAPTPFGGGPTGNSDPGHGYGYGGYSNGLANRLGGPGFLLLEFEELPS